MQTKHTPGPWKAKGSDGRYDNRKNSWSVVDEDAACSEAAPITLADGTVVAFAVQSEDDYFQGTRTDSNARLIAAAPELLSVALAVDDLAERIDHDPDSALGELVARARAAIAKATGAEA